MVQGKILLPTTLNYPPLQRRCVSQTDVYIDYLHYRRTISGLLSRFFVGRRALARMLNAFLTGAKGWTACTIWR